MSSEDGEWSDCEWFDEVATNIILDIERSQLAMEIQVESLSIKHVIIILRHSLHWFPSNQESEDIMKI